MSDELIRQRHRAITRPWRLAFVFAALALTVATHWPKLQLSPGIPATDKTIHAIAFGFMTYLLWHTRWIGRRWVVVFVMLIWAGLDELSQGIPVLNRHVTWEDAVANAMGVAIVGLGLWAAAPVGHEANRLRLRLHRAAFDETFRDPRTWFALVGIALACGGPVFVVYFMIGLKTGLSTAILIATAVWAMVSVATFWSIRRHAMRWTVVKRACFDCATSNRRSSFDEHGSGRCGGCRLPLHRGQWSLPSPPPMPIQSCLFVRPLLIGLIIVLAGFGLLALAPIVYDAAISNGVGQSVLPGLARSITQLNASLVRVVDFTVLVAVTALVVRMYRRRLGGFYDRGDTCVRCGHDLRATPTIQGVGRCGECGQKFVVGIPTSNTPATQ